MLTPRTNSLTFWPKEVSQEMNGTTFFVCSTSWVSRSILVAVSKTFFLSGQRAVSGATSKRGQNTTSNDGSPTAKARPIFLVVVSQGKEAISSQSSGSLVNPVNDDERKRAGLASGNCGSFDSNFEVEYSEVSRQEKVILASKKTRPNQKVRRTSLARGNLMHHYQNWRTWNSRIIDTRARSFSVLHKKLGMSATNATYYQYKHTKQMYWYEGCSWRRRWRPPSIFGWISEDFGELQEYEIREHWECVQHQSKIDKRTFVRKFECKQPEIFTTIMDEIDIGQRPNDQMGECKSVCLRWFRSMCRTDERHSRSSKKMERPSWRSQDAVIIPRCIWNRWRSNWTRAEKFSGFSTLTILQEIQKDLEKENIQLENFSDRIIFMSMFNDIEWKTNDENCISNAEKVKNYALRYSQGHWTFLSPGSEERSWSKKRRKVQFIWMEILWTRNSCFKQFVLSISSIYGAVTNWCYQFGLTNDEKERVNVGVSSEPGNLETRCKEARDSECGKKIHMTQLCEKGPIPTSCDSRKFLQKIDRMRTTDVEQLFSVLRVFEFLTISENPQLWQLFPKAQSLDQFWKFICENSWRICDRSCNSINVKTPGHILCWLQYPEKLSALRVKIHDHKEKVRSSNELLENLQ